MVPLCVAVVLVNGIANASNVPLLKEVSPVGQTSGALTVAASQDEPDLEAIGEGTPRWMSGINRGGETFSGTVDKGTSVFGSNLIATFCVEVELRFSNTTTVLRRGCHLPIHVSEET